MQRVPSLTLQEDEPTFTKSKTLIATKTTRDSELESQKSKSFLGSNRSFFKKGIFSHKLIE